MIAPEGRADAGAFVARLLRLDPASVVRLRPIAAGRAELWAMLPFRVLVTRTVAAALDADTTVAGAELLETLAGGGPLPARRDEAWRWPLPPSRGRVLETLPAAEVARVAAAASRTLRAAATEGVGGRLVGERVVRDALLDHVPIVVIGPERERVEVPQRLVQAVTRMGFLGPESLVTSGNSTVTVRLATRWICLDGSYGSAWYRPSSPLRLV